MGLVIIGALAVYLLISIAVVIGAVRFARNNGKSTKRWGWSAALVMYLIPFWDWIPTVVVHQYYCSKEAGFAVYKTLDQWKKENPGVMETLAANANLRAQSHKSNHEASIRDSYSLNDSFDWVVMQEDVFSFLSIIRIEKKVVDARRNEILARYIDFGSGNSVKKTIAPPGPWKFWLVNRHCAGGERNQGLMYLFVQAIEGVKQ